MSPFSEPEPWVPASPRISPTPDSVPASRCRSRSARSGRAQRRRGRAERPPRRVLRSRIRRPDHHRQLRRRSREDRGLRLDHRSRHRKPLHQTRALRQSDRASRPRRHRLHQHQRHSARADRRRLPGRISRALSRHAFLQSAALSASGRNDSRACYPPGDRLASSPISATAIWAKASSPAKTRRTSSPTASALSSVPPFSA